MLNEQQVLKILREVSNVETKPEYIKSDFIEKIIKPWQEQTPKFEDFTDYYDREEISKDMQALKKRKETFKETKSAIGSIGQYIMAQGIYDENWIPAVETVIPTNRYDDVFNGTDLVFRFCDDEGNHFYLGVDVKTIRDRDIIDSKTEKVRSYAREGKISRLKYFDDEFQKGFLSLPSLVMGIDPGYAMVIQEALLKDSKQRTELENDKVMLIKQIMNLEFLTQLMSWDMFFKSENLIGSRYDAIHHNYIRILDILIAATDMKSLMRFLDELIQAAQNIKHQNLIKTFSSYRESIKIFRKYNPDFKY